MLSHLQIFLSSFIILTISTCCTARTYNFSWQTTLWPEKDTYAYDGVTYKLLKHGEPCEYEGTINYYKNATEAKGHCRESAGLVCLGRKCVCDPMNDPQVWDPKVRYVSRMDDVDFPEQSLTGSCAREKGHECWDFEGQPGSGNHRCKDDLICVYENKTAQSQNQNKRRRKRRGVALALYESPPESDDGPKGLSGICQ